MSPCQSQLETVHTRFGWQTSNLRKYLRLEKSKNKAEQSPESHANDGIDLACFQFLDYLPFHASNGHRYDWKGSVKVTNAPFAVIKRPPISRRQLHLMVFSKGGKLRKYGGSTTRHGFRKGDLVSSPKGIGYISGDTEKQLSISDTSWKRLGQITVSKIQLIRRSNGLIVSH
ncbi:hypothetical protein myaer87_35530 [Microcystis aeruginosa NIES-87]|nr:hypothetical protein myaer87_35530 [Microcystis aeruginosa NIES-87]